MRPHDSTNLIISIYTVNAAGDVLQDYNYTRDLNGNITVADEGTRTVYYEYDALGRLTKETVEDASGTHVTEYSYDANSNRISKTVDGVATRYTYNELNQLVQAGDTTYTYDNAGNLVSQSVSGTLVVAYEYDEFNRLISVTGYAAGNEYDASFTYDDDGSRTSKTFNGTTTYYITDSSSGYSQILKSITGGETTYYVRGFNLISRSDGTDTYYYLTDVTGSIRGLTDESGIVTDAYAFDSFGNVTESTGTTDNNYGFRGEEQDEMGLVYLRARYMDPETGRFLSMDSYGGNLSDPISQNRYLFANSNPVKYKDPSGHFSLVEMGETMLMSALIGTVLGEVYTYADYFVTGQEIGSTKYGSDFVKNTLSGFLLGGVISALAVGAIPYLSLFAVAVIIISVMLVSALLISEYILTEIGLSVDIGEYIYGSPSAGISIEPDGGITIDVDSSYGITTEADQSLMPDVTFSASFYPCYTNANEVGESITIGFSIPTGSGSVGLDFLFSSDDDGNERNGFEGVSFTYSPQNSFPEIHFESSLPFSYTLFSWGGN